MLDDFANSKTLSLQQKLSSVSQYFLSYAGFGGKVTEITENVQEENESAAKDIVDEDNASVQSKTTPEDNEGDTTPEDSESQQP